ncbi:MAG: hypothetical protein ACR2M9_00205 [Cyanophyceae cyanobacterium]
MPKPTMSEVEANLSRHEAVCAERWLEILHRVQRLEAFVIGANVTILLGMGGILANLIF